MVTDLWYHFTYNPRGAWHTVYAMLPEEQGIQCMPCSSKIISQLLPEIHTMQNYDFHKPITHSQIFLFRFIYVWHVSTEWLDARHDVMILKVLGEALI